MTREFTEEELAAINSYSELGEDDDDDDGIDDSPLVYAFCLGMTANGSVETTWKWGDDSSRTAKLTGIMLHRLSNGDCREFLIESLQLYAQKQPSNESFIAAILQEWRVAMESDEKTYIKPSSVTKTQMAQS